MSHSAANILQYQQIIVSEIPPGGSGSIATPRYHRAKESKVLLSFNFIYLWLVNPF